MRFSVLLFSVKSSADDLFRSDGRLAAESNDVEDIDADEAPAGLRFIHSIAPDKVVHPCFST